MKQRDNICIERLVNLFSRNYILIILAVLSIWVSVINVGGNYIIHFIDIMWPLYPYETLKSLLFTWNNEGYGVFFTINIFNFPTIFLVYLLKVSYLSYSEQEIVLFSILQFIGSVFTFKLFKEFVIKLDKNFLNDILAFVSVLFIVFGQATSWFYWRDFLPQGLVLLSFGSMYLYYLARQFSYFLQGKSTITGWFAIFSTSFFAFSVELPFILSFIALTIFVPIFLITDQSHTKIRVNLRRTIEFLLLVVAIVIFSNIWWIYPSYLESLAVPGVYSANSTLQSNLLILIASSRYPMLNLFRFLYSVGGPFGFDNINNYIYNVFGGPTTYFLLGIIMIGVTPTVKFSRNKFYILLAEWFVLSLFMLGTNSPLSKMIVYLVLSNSIASEALRNPIVALSNAYYFILTAVLMLAASRIFSLLEKKERRRNPLIKNHVTLVLKMHSWNKLIAPVILILLISSSFTLSSPIFTGDAIPHSPYKARVQIPTYEYNVASFLSHNATNHYAILYPGGFIEQNWTHGYDSYDILQYMAPNALLIDGVNPTLGRNEIGLISNIYNYLESPHYAYYSFSNDLYSINAKYVIVEGMIGKNYPFGGTESPNYRQTLQSLNLTIGIKFLKSIGPDYIYALNETPIGLVSPAESIVNIPSLLDGNVIPSVNITRAFFNDSMGNSSLLNLNASWNGGIRVSANASEKEIISNLSQGILFFNTFPLGINISDYQYLILKLKSNVNTAFSLLGVTNLSLNQSTLSGSDVKMYGTSNDQGFGNNATVENSLGGNHYYSPTRAITMVIDLHKALSLTNTETLNYIAFQLWAVTQNGTGLRFVPISQWPGYQNLTIRSMELGNKLNGSEGTLLSNYTNFHRQNGSIFLDLVQQFNDSYKVTSIEENPSQYAVSISNLSYSDKTILLAFFQNIAGLWKLTNLEGIVKYQLITLDNITQGILIYPVHNITTVSFDIVQPQQRTLSFFLDVMFVTYTSVPIAIISLIVWRKRS